MAKVSRIEYIGKGKVRNLTVRKNHTFVTENGIVTHNCDAADPGKVLCLQSVLEGKPVFIKKLGKKIFPAAGFTVFATANTKGKGSDDGRFVGTNVMNEAFLDRFSITIEQNYPTAAIEKKMITGYAEQFSGSDLSERTVEVVNNLVQWAQITRQTFNEGAIDELISTRRLVSAVETYFIFGENINKAIEYTIARFDNDVKESFGELYQQIDSGMRKFEEDEA